MSSRLLRPYAVYMYSHALYNDTHILRTLMPIKVVLDNKSMVLKVVSSGSEASYAPKSMKIRK